MFENTSNAMRQLLQAMDLVRNVDELELSRDEKLAYQALFEQCESFVAQAGYLEEGDQDFEDGNEDCGLETCKD
jgi:hypothetical protein